MKKSTVARQIYITDFDLQRLEELIEAATARSTRDSSNIEQLEEELLKAEVVDPAGIPPDVVTMNSKVCLKDLDSGEELEYTLVFPPEANLAAGKISILAPVGTAMFGYRAGDRISWAVPGGTRKLKIKKVLYQPEAAGDYHL
ncbi:MAG: nucleoside diphosphate kinase regulator [Geobacter sp.]|jgi:regulator of nucleoside diphosphate kinase|nr:nucleoside diphosphate kinase regulator [Geobacter sp.]